jgi:serine phosphatase RsbU (regulator of sigma subunit)
MRVFTNKIKAILILLSLAVLAAMLAACSSPTGRAAGTEGTFPGTNLEFFEDRTGKLQINDVSSPGSRERFSPVPGDTLTMGTIKSTFWFRFTIAQGAGDGAVPPRIVEIAYPSLERVTLYVPAPRGSGWNEKTAGEEIPFRLREISHRNIAFYLPPASGEPFTCYIRVFVEKVMIFPFRLWSLEGFSGKNYTEQLVHGIYFGIMCAMLLYNLFLLLSLKDRSYLYYILYISSFMLFQISYTGFGFEFLWPSSPWWNVRANIFFVFLSLFWALKFFSSYLMTRIHTPRMHHYFTAIMAVSVLGGILTFILDRTTATNLSNVVPLAGAILALAAGTACLVRGYRPARYYMIAWALFLSGVVLFVLKNFNVLPGNLVTIYGIQFGSALEVVFFSLGLADRINIMNTDREKARDELLSLHRELDIARQIQSSLLPAGMPSIPFLSMAAHFQPAHSVGGDYYDFYRLGGDRLGIMLADASGHGLPAALLAPVIKVAFSQEAAGSDDPGNVMEGLNRALVGKLGRQFITASYTIIDMERMRGINSCAGHPPLILQGRRSGTIRVINPQGAVLGAFRDRVFRSEPFPFADCDRLVFYTDGVTEARNTAGELWGDERLHSLLRDHPLDSPDKLISLLLSALETWRGHEGAFEDDLTIIIVDIDRPS